MIISKAPPLKSCLSVPAAWMALFGYSFIFFASVTALVFRHPLGHVAARAAAP